MGFSVSNTMDYRAVNTPVWRRENVPQMAAFCHNPVPNLCLEFDRFERLLLRRAVTPDETHLLAVGLKLLISAALALETLLREHRLDVGVAKPHARTRRVGGEHVAEHLVCLAFAATHHQKRRRLREQLFERCESSRRCIERSHSELLYSRVKQKRHTNVRRKETRRGREMTKRNTLHPKLYINRRPKTATSTTPSAKKNCDVRSVTARRFRFVNSTITLILKYRSSNVK